MISWMAQEDSVDCREACGRMEEFYRGELPAEELEDFLSHIRGCRECEEELKVYITIEVGLEQLDDDSSGIYDPEGAYSQCISEAERAVDWHLMWKSFQYAMTTIAFWFATLAFLMQARGWFPRGIF